MKAPVTPATRAKASSRDATTGEAGEPIARFVAFAPAHLQAPSAEVEAWLRGNLPRGVTRDEAVLPLADEPARLNREYAGTLRAIERARLPRRVALMLATSLVSDGEKAKLWRDAGYPDKYARARAADSAFLEKLPSVRNAALRLAQHFEGPLAPSGFASEAAALRLEQEGARIVAPLEEGGSVNMRAALARFLRLYAETVESHHGAKRGPWAHRSVSPPFIYNGRVHESPPWGDALKRGLLWRATWHARRLTGGTGSRNQGAPMFKGGKPLWKVAAALVQDVTGEHTSADAAQDALSAFIRRNPGVGFYEWPEPQPDR